MRVLLQRCKKASVYINNTVYSTIDGGLVLLVGFCKSDSEQDVELMVNKIAKLRIFADCAGKINLNITQMKYSILSVSQYSLYANYEKGNRPSFTENLEVIKAKKLYHLFNEKLSNIAKVETGVFQEDMEVSLVNDGPFTMMLDSTQLRRKQ